MEMGGGVERRGEEREEVEQSAGMLYLRLDKAEVTTTAAAVVYSGTSRAREDVRCDQRSPVTWHNPAPASQQLVVLKQKKANIISSRT